MTPSGVSSVAVNFVCTAKSYISVLSCFGSNDSNLSDITGKPASHGREIPNKVRGREIKKKKTTVSPHLTLLKILSVPTKVISWFGTIMPVSLDFSVLSNYPADSKRGTRTQWLVKRLQDIKIYVRLTGYIEELWEVSEGFPFLCSEKTSNEARCCYRNFSNVLVLSGTYTHLICGFDGSMQYLPR